MVVGGGPAGLIAAEVLALAGVPVTVGHPDSAQAKAFRSVASAAVARVQAVAGLKLPDLR